MEPASDHPDFWSFRYDAGTTPWDSGGVPPALARFLQRLPARGQRVLIPGCGFGYEIAAFAAAGHDVVALDFSAPAVALARATVGPALADRIVHGDFFTHALPAAGFDLVYERTFLCALPPARWPEIAARTAALLRPGGYVAGFYFIGPKDDGPPHGLDPGEPDRLFGPAFALEHDAPVPPAESLPLFAGREHWQERRLRPL
jgi:SAM-dependent methyltransferase